MRTVLYHPKVPAEVRGFLDHYDEISPDLGDAFWQELMEGRRCVLLKEGLRTLEAGFPGRRRARGM